MVEPAIDQSLAQIGCGFAVVGQETRSRASFAHGYLRQKAHIEASQIDGGVACTGVAGPDVQGRREGVVTDIRCVVTGATSALKGPNAPGNQTPGCHIVVDAMLEVNLRSPRVTCPPGCSKAGSKKCFIAHDSPRHKASSSLIFLVRERTTALRCVSEPISRSRAEEEVLAPCNHDSVECSLVRKWVEVGAQLEGKRRVRARTLLATFPVPITCSLRPWQGSLAPVGAAAVPSDRPAPWGRVWPPPPRAPRYRRAGPR